MILMVKERDFSEGFKTRLFTFPMLLNLVVDALSAMLSSSARAGDLGVVLQLIKGGLTNLQYADDTIIFLKRANVNIRNLNCFILF